MKVTININLEKEAFKEIGISDFVRSEITKLATLLELDEHYVKQSDICSKINYLIMKAHPDFTKPGIYKIMTHLNEYCGDIIVEES